MAGVVADGIVVGAPGGLVVGVPGSLVVGAPGGVVVGVPGGVFVGLRLLITVAVVLRPLSLEPLSWVGCSLTDEDTGAGVLEGMASGVLRVALLPVLVENPLGAGDSMVGEANTLVPSVSKLAADG